MYSVFPTKTESTTFFLGTFEESISNLVFALAVFVVPDSGTYNATHGKQDSVTADSNCEAHGVHVGEHTTTHDLLDTLKVLTENETVETNKQTIGRVSNGLYIIQSGCDAAEDIVKSSQGIMNTGSPTCRISDSDVSIFCSSKDS